MEDNQLYSTDEIKTDQTQRETETEVTDNSMETDTFGEQLGTDPLIDQEGQDLDLGTDTTDTEEAPEEQIY